MQIAILGAGESGVGAAVLAQQQGLEAFVSDRGRIKDTYRQVLEKKGIPYEEGRHSDNRILAASEVIKSPGIPDEAPLVQQLLKQGTAVISEVEFAARYTTAQLIGITGSNGKTTTSSLTWHLLQAGGLDVSLAGNVGRSFAWQVAEADSEYYVLELSSFQLDGIRQFRPFIAMLLNISPDHLDRYEHQMSNYIRSKFRITQNQKWTDYFLYNGDDTHIMANLLAYGSEAENVNINSRSIKGSHLKFADTQFDLAPTALIGRHNAMNALFAVTTARLFGLSTPVIQRGLETFQPVPHRLEVLGEIDGLRYINDSKATNVDAVYYALEAMDRPIIWIVGGQDKGNDYAPLLELVRQKVKALVCLGIDNTKIKSAFAPLGKPLAEVQTVVNAIQQAREWGEAGDVVLLSPACASFDLFSNYADRGDQFRQAVLNEQQKGSTTKKLK